MVTTEKVQKLSVWHLIAGIIMAALGIFVWFNPMASLVAMALYLGIVFIVVGAGYFMASFAYRSGWYLLVGFLDMLVGVIFVANLGGDGCIAADYFCPVVSGRRGGANCFGLSAAQQRRFLGVDAYGRNSGCAVCLFDSGVSGHRYNYPDGFDGRLYPDVRDY